MFVHKADASHRSRSASTEDLENASGSVYESGSEFRKLLDEARGASCRGEGSMATDGPRDDTEEGFKRLLDEVLGVSDAALSNDCVAGNAEWLPRRRRQSSNGQRSF